MPFIVQCPHPDCRKYILLEDAMRGAAAECLVCKRMIQVDPSGPGDRRKPPKQAWAQAPNSSTAPPPPTASRQKIVTCPGCSTPLRLPSSHQRQPIRCPRCSHVFAP